jgi:epoxyqueuosine reductase QueG
MGNRIYGCDDCLAVCPWNKFAQTSREVAFHPRIELTRPLLANWRCSTMRRFANFSALRRSSASDATGSCETY